MPRQATGAVNPVAKIGVEPAESDGVVPSALSRSTFPFSDAVSPLRRASPPASNAAYSFPSGPNRSAAAGDADAGTPSSTTTGSAKVSETSRRRAMENCTPPERVGRYR